MQLYTHCEDVERVNAQRLAELPGDSVRFTAQDTGRTDALQACQVWQCPCLSIPCNMPGHALAPRGCATRMRHSYQFKDCRGLMPGCAMEKHVSASVTSPSVPQAPQHVASMFSLLS